MPGPFLNLPDLLGILALSAVLMFIFATLAVVSGVGWDYFPMVVVLVILVFIGSFIAKNNSRGW